MYVADVVITGTCDRACVDAAIADTSGAFAIDGAAWCPGIGIARNAAAGTVTIAQR